MNKYLDAALEALNFIEAQRVPDRAVWRISDEPDARISHTLYSGSGGVILLLLELHAATGSKDLLDRAIRAGDETLAYLESVDWLPVNVSAGWASYAFVMSALAKATGHDRYRASAARCVERLGAASVELGAGIGWIEPMPFSEITGFTGERELFDQSIGSAGVILLLLSAHRQNLHEKALSWAVAAGDRLLEIAERDADGLRWRMMADMPFPFKTPGFAHGGAGVGYAMSQLYRMTGEERFLGAAKEAARYVMSRSHPMGPDGCLVCHNEEVIPHIFYLSVCHGPAGTGRLLLELQAITGEAAWGEHLRQLVAGVEYLGAPEQRSEGFWRNYSQCCGDAGLGEFALLLARTAGGAYRELAVRCGDAILAHSDLSGDQRRWRQAEHRNRPDFIQAQTGYMQGAAGIASFLTHLATTIEGRPVKIYPPDWPAPLAPHSSDINP
ncbi:MAG: lanthionine synthetase LanC family protein [Blastocatellales bacterium]